MTGIVERLRRNAARMSDLDRAKEDLTLAGDEIERLRGLLADKHYIQFKADYNRGHLSHHGWLQAREQALTVRKGDTDAQRD